jgi:phenylalanyl-tRNA synthetase beta chain
MPRIEVDRSDLLQLAGMPADTSDASLEEALATLKAELDGGGPRLSIELNDTNRPDLWCAEGVARGLAGLSGRRYRHLAGTRPSGLSVAVDASVGPVRPWIALFLAEGGPLSETALEAMIAAQEKLASSFGRNRRTAAIGIHRAAGVSFPLTYATAGPDGFRMVPLGGGAAMTPSEILSGTETGARYSGLLDPQGPFPVLLDSRGDPVTFPPVINSETHGRVAPGDTRLLCDVTGTDWTAVHLAATIMACNMEDRGWRIGSVGVVYPFPTPSGPSVETPVVWADRLEAGPELIGRILGFMPDGGEIRRALEAMGWLEVEVTGGAVRAVLPPYRHDGIHPVDLVEDIVTGYGLERIAPLQPSAWTTGSASPSSALADAVRIILVGAGCEELLLPVLTSASRPGALPGVIVLENPMTLEYGAVRNSILPGLLSVEAASAHAPYPHRLFEIGEVLRRGAGPETVHSLGVAVFGNDAAFGDAHSLLALVCRQRGLDLSLAPASDDRFIEGRAASASIGGRTCGVLGEFHPGVLERSGIQRPGAAFELDMGALGGDLQG